MKLFTKEVLKDFHDFHKFNVGDKVIVLWEWYDKFERIATIKDIHIHFKNGELGNLPIARHRTALYYYFKEFDGWLSEDKILKKL